MSNVVRFTPPRPPQSVKAARILTADASRLFHPLEHDILRQYFGLRLRKSDLQAIAEAPDQPGIRIDSELDKYGLENAVARLCLGAIQERLPQWGCTRADGSVVFGREFYSRSVRKIESKPVYLFTINWADSGPGISWPVSYHATWIPGYERWVVTASADGTDCWGCADIAIGTFRGTDIRSGAGRVIRKDWRSAYLGYDQAPWAYLFETGLIGEEEALVWRKQVWGRRDGR